MKRRDELMKRAGANDKDIERKALFHILASDDLYPLIDDIYDFDNYGGIKSNILGYTEAEIDSTQEVMIRIAFHLYNGYSKGMSCLKAELSKLDGKNLEIVKEAIKIRYGV